MKISPISFNKIQKQYSNENKPKANFGFRYDYINPYQYTTPVIYYMPQTHSIYEDYDTAKDIFKDNIAQGMGIFGDDSDNIEELMENDRIRRNVVKFFSEYSSEEIDKIDKKKIVSIDELNYREGLKEVNQFFGEFLESWPESELPKDNYYSIPQKTLAFAGNMKPEDEKVCKNIVHVFSLACGGVSAAMGEGAAIGADTPILRTAQFIMFAIMAEYLHVPAVPSLEYYTKEMLSGATLGVGGAKLITSWLGIGGHAVSTISGTSLTTAGGSDAAISGGVRAVNGTLSTLITEKMGRGYIRRVKENKMTFKDQTLETGLYILNSMILTGEKNPFNLFKDISLKNSSDPELIKEALLKISPEQAKATSTILDVIKKTGIKTAEGFLVNTAITLLATKEKDPEKRVRIAKDIFKQCLIRSMAYDLCNEINGKGISKEATRTIEDIQKNLDKYPEVYHTFIEKEAEFIKQINIQNLSSDAFVAQFKNKLFVSNLSRFCNTLIRDMEIKWVNRDGSKHADEMKALDKSIKEENKKSTNSPFTAEEEAEISQALSEIEKIIASQKIIMTARDNFGYGRISGYENVKSILREKFITPLSLKNTSIDIPIPNAILLYGPTGVGKTELAKAVAEQGKCKLIPFDDVESNSELKEWLDSKFAEANNASRHYIIQIDEFDEFCEDNETTKIFEEYIKNANKNNVTFILTTNNPLDINDKLLQETVNIPIAPADKKDALQVLKHYNSNLTDDEYSEIVDLLFDKSQDGAYSNGQIQHISAMANASQNNSFKKENMLKLIQKSHPEIAINDIAKFQSEQEKIRSIV